MVTGTSRLTRLKRRSRADHWRIRWPRRRPMAGSHHRCHHQNPPQSTTPAPHHRHPSRRRHRHRRPPSPTTPKPGSTPSTMPDDGTGCATATFGPSPPSATTGLAPPSAGTAPSKLAGVAAHGFGDADDIAAVLHYRVERSTVCPTRSGRTRKPPRLIASLNPAGHGVIDSEMRAALDKREELTEARADAILEAALTESAPWTKALGT